MVVLFDFESRSRADLKRVGGRLYWADPSTEALCCCWHDTDTNSSGTWFPGDAVPAPIASPGAVLAAHNVMSFDRFGCYRYGWPEPAEWIDTCDLARRSGIPGALDELGKRWLGVPKDSAGSRLTRSMSTVHRPAGRGPDAISREDWRALSTAQKRKRGKLAEVTWDKLERIVGYCASDVEILRCAWPSLQSWGEFEPDVLTAHQAINERGVCFDSALARALIECDRHNSDLVIADVAQELWATPEEVRRDAASPKRFCAITGAENAQADTVALLDHPLARARRALATIASGKLRAGLARVSPDGRIRDSHIYCGAHTWRWSSAGMQLHNLPRPDEIFKSWTPEQIEELADRVRDRKHQASPTEIELLIRSCLTAAPEKRLVVRDYSGIEARALAWCAGDEPALDVFRSGGDPYKVIACDLFGTTYDAVSDQQRYVGKVTELACGYGMWANKFEENAKKNGLDLESVNLTGKQAVLTWRGRHPAIVRFWANMERGWRLAAEGHANKISCFDFVPSANGRDVLLYLPTGRPIAYNEARVQPSTRRPDGWDMSYHGNKGRAYVYGGLIVENAIQALCRDPLATSLVEAERAGLNPVLHVHDEPVCEVDVRAADEAAAYLDAIMVEAWAWATGCPVKTGGFTSRRYRK